MVKTRHLNILLSFVLVAVMAVCAAAIMPNKAFAAGKSYASAEKISLDKWKGDVVKYEDNSEEVAHYYTFKTSSRAGSNYDFKAEWTDGYSQPANTNLTVDYRIFDTNYNEISYGYISKNGNPAFCQNPVLKTNKKYFLVVKLSHRSWQGSGCIKTRFMIKENPAPPSTPNVSIKVGTKKMTVSWNCSRATKYEVKMRVKNGTWKTYKVNGKTKTFKNLKKGKVYQVKVKGIRVVNNKSYNGAWSAAKNSAKIK